MLPIVKYDMQSADMVQKVGECMIVKEVQKVQNAWLLPIVKYDMHTASTKASLGLSTGWPWMSLA